MSSPTPQDFEKASQIWCQPKHSKKEFDSELAQSFAQALAEEREKREQCLKGCECDAFFRQRERADSLESEKSLLEKRVAVLEDMERQVMDLSHPNFKELQAKNANLEKRIEELSGMAQSAKDNRRAYEVQKEKNANLEKRVREAEAKLEAMPYVMHADEKIALGRIGQLEAENERLKAEVEKLRKDWMIEQHEDTSEGFWGRSCARLQRKNTELESRLAEAVRVLDCALVDLRGIIPLAYRVGKTDVSLLRRVKSYGDFLDSPTTSKALEIARAKDMVVEACRHATARDFSVNEALKALDALTSEEGKV